MTTPLAGRGIQSIIGDYHYSLIRAIGQIYQRLNLPAPSFKYNAAQPPSPSNRFIVEGTPSSAKQLKGLSVAECLENLTDIRRHIGYLIDGIEVDVEENDRWIYPEDWPGWEGEPGSVTLERFHGPRYVRLVRYGTSYGHYESITEFAEDCGITDLQPVDACKWNARGGRDWSDTAILLASMLEFEIWPQFYIDNLATQESEGRGPAYDPNLNEWDTGPLYVGRGTLTASGTYYWSYPGDITAAVMADMPDYLADGWEAFVAQTGTFYPDTFGYGAEYQGGVGVLGGWADGYSRYPEEPGIGYWIYYHHIYARFGAETVPPYIMYETGVYASAIRALEWPVRYSLGNLKSGSNVTFIFGEDSIQVPDALRGKFRDFVDVDPFNPVEPELTCEIPETSPFQWESPEDFYVTDRSGNTVFPLEPIIANANWAWAWPNHEGPRYIATLDTNSYIPV